MRRRAVLGALLALPLATAAMGQERRPRIVILHSGFPQRVPLPLLIEDLRLLGYEEGRSASIEIHGAEGDPERLAGLVARLTAAPPDVTVAITSLAAGAVKAAGLATPVVFMSVTDPVRLGLVQSLSHPGGNFTGTTSGDGLLGGKRIELLIDLLPGLRRVAILWSRANAEHTLIFEAARAAAVTRELVVISRGYGGVEDLSSAFAEVKAAGAEAVFFQPSNATFGHRTEIARLALAHRLPSVHSFVPEVEDGALMSFGEDLREIYRRAAALIDKILKGTNPADLPVEEPTRFALAVNLKTAAALGLVIPPAILARADEVIE